MCTALCYEGLFGRTLDLDKSYDEEAVIMPRAHGVCFCHGDRADLHPAIIGCALVKEGVPLWFDAINEHGLGAAALNFPEHAVYRQPTMGKHNIASYELIPWVLCRCGTVDEAEELLSGANITEDAFSPDLHPTPLHWIIADGRRSITVEVVSDGMRIYENPFGVLTNTPPFPEHVGRARIAEKLTPDSASALPGDWSSSSRFLRSLFTKKYTAGGGVSDFFHIMDTVKVPNGCGRKDWRTVYTSCADLARGEYYFTTYENRRIRKLSLAAADLESDNILRFSMRGEEDIDDGLIMSSL